MWGGEEVTNCIEVCPLCGPPTWKWEVSGSRRRPRLDISRIGLDTCPGQGRGRGRRRNRESEVERLCSALPERSHDFVAVRSGRAGRSVCSPSESCCVRRRRHGFLVHAWSKCGLVRRPSRYHALESTGQVVPRDLCSVPGQQIDPERAFNPLVVGSSPT